jgi:hypothetical protein
MLIQQQQHNVKPAAAQTPFVMRRCDQPLGHKAAPALTVTREACLRTLWIKAPTGQEPSLCMSAPQHWSQRLCCGWSPAQQGAREGCGCYTATVAAMLESTLGGVGHTQDTGPCAESRHHASLQQHTTPHNGLSSPTLCSAIPAQ